MEVDDEGTADDQSGSEDEQALRNRIKSKKTTGHATSKASTPTAASPSSSRSRAKATLSSSTPRARTGKTRVLAADSQEDGEDENGDEEEEDLPEVEEALKRSVKGRGKAPARATRGRAPATVILDTDDEEDQNHNKVLETEEVSDDEFIAPRRGTSAASKGKGRAKRYVSARRFSSSQSSYF